MDQLQSVIETLTCKSLTIIADRGMQMRKQSGVRQISRVCKGRARVCAQ